MAFEVCFAFPSLLAQGKRRVGIRQVCNRAETPQMSSDGVAYVLSHFEAADFLRLRKETQAADHNQGRVVQGEFSVDLGHSKLDSAVVLRDGIWLPPADGEGTLTGNSPMATWNELSRMTKKGRSGAFEVFSDGTTEPRRVSAHSETTGRTASLMPIHRGKPPTMVLAGFTMHRVVRSDPGTDTQQKLAALRHGLCGRVLDVCTGLGYTALGMADREEVREVVTIEVDPMVQNMISRNPWSRRLLHHDSVQCVIGGALDVVKGMEHDIFDAVVHDPPAHALCGELYSGEMYQALSRVVKKGGILFHYIGERGSRESGRLYAGVGKRLREAGFGDVTPNDDAYGVTAVRI